MGKPGNAWCGRSTFQRLEVAFASVNPDLNLIIIIVAYYYFRKWFQTSHLHIAVTLNSTLYMLKITKTSFPNGKRQRVIRIGFSSFGEIFFMLDLKNSLYSYAMLRTKSNVSIISCFNFQFLQFSQMVVLYCIYLGVLLLLLLQCLD